MDRVEDVHIGLIRRVTVLGAVSGKGVSDGRKDVEKPKRVWHANGCAALGLE